MDQAFVRAGYGDSRRRLCKTVSRDRNQRCSVHRSSSSRSLTVTKASLKAAGAGFGVKMKGKVHQGG